MIPRNIIDKSGTFADQSRISNPSLGSATGFWNLEKGQHGHTKQHDLSFMESKGHEVSEKVGVSAVAGFPENTRIRKPPGGDTNDIFGMEDRQRVQAHVQKFRKNDEWGKTEVSKLNIDISQDQENECTKDTSDFGNLLNQLSLSKPVNLSSYQMDKENVNLFSERVDQVYGKVKNKFSDNMMETVDEKFGDESKPATKTYFRRNPITGEVMEVKVTFRSKLLDCSNNAQNQDRAEMEKGYEAQRTSVRIRQPPGGISSNIF